MKKIIIKSTIITSTIIIIICIISFSYKQENNNKQETKQTNTKITESKFIYGKNNKKTETPVTDILEETTTESTVPFKESTFDNFLSEFVFPKLETT